MRLLISLLLNGLIVFIAAYLTPNVAVDGYLSAIIVGAVLGLVNAIIRPILTLLTLPITFLTLGLFLLVINGAMVLLVDALLPGFSVAGLLWAIIFSLVLTIFNSLFGMSGRKEERR